MIEFSEGLNLGDLLGGLTGGSQNQPNNNPGDAIGALLGGILSGTNVDVNQNNYGQGGQPQPDPGNPW